MYHNINGIPLWMIKRSLVCQINLNDEFKSFSIDDDGNIFLDEKLASHIDLAVWEKPQKLCYVPLSIGA